MQQVRIPLRQHANADQDVIIQPAIIRIVFINGTFLHGASHPSIHTALNRIDLLANYRPITLTGQYRDEGSRLTLFKRVVLYINGCEIY